jgi:hypothetical protein
MEKKGGFCLMKSNELLAVHDDDLVTLLKSLEKYDDVVSGKCACIFCQQAIKLSNIGSIIPLEGKVVFSCNDDSCLNNLVRGGGSNDS